MDHSTHWKACFLRSGAWSRPVHLGSHQVSTIPDSTCEQVVSPPSFSHNRDLKGSLGGAGVQGEDAQGGHILPDPANAATSGNHDKHNVSSHRVTGNEREAQGLDMLVTMVCALIAGPPRLSNCPCCRLGWAGRAGGLSGGGGL